MNYGLKPVRHKDHRMYDFGATFGAAVNIPQEFSFDVFNTFPDQNTDGSPNGCTSYMETEIASNEDRIYYNDKRFTYENSKLIEGVSGEVPVRMESAVRSGVVYGVKTALETAQDALSHRRAPYFIIRPTTDYFDAIVSAMWVKPGCVGLGTPWLPEFEQVGPDGIIKASIDPRMGFSSGHAWCAVGVKMINGERYIMAKSWQGANYGDKGLCYFNRVHINALLSIGGSIAMTQKHATPEDIRRVEMTLIQTTLSYLWRMFYLIIDKMRV